MALPNTEAKKAAQTVIIREKGTVDRNYLGVIVTPDNVERYVRQASQGELGPLQEIYAIMETDSRYSGLVNSIYASVASLPIKIKPSKTGSRAAKKAFKLVEEMFGPGKLTLQEVKRKFTKPYIRGVCAWEVMWQLMDGSDGNQYLFPYKLEPIPGTRLGMDIKSGSETYGEITIIDKPSINGLGTPVSKFQESKILVLTDGSTDPGWYDHAGGARRCLRWWLTKTYTHIWWNQFNETYGEPPRMAFVPPGYKNSKIKEVEKFLQKLGRWMYGIFDQGINIELLNPAAMGTTNTYKQIMEMAHQEMAVALHGQIQTSDGGEYGSYAKAVVQWDIRQEIIKMICEIIQEGLEWLITYFVRFNVDTEFDAVDMPQIEINMRPSADKKTLADTFEVVTKFMDVSVDQMYEQLELEKPKEGEETIGPKDRSKESVGDVSSNGSAQRGSTGESGKNSVGSGRGDYPPKN